MNRLGSLDHFDNFKRNVLAVQSLEQSRAAVIVHCSLRIADLDLLSKSCKCPAWAGFALRLILEEYGLKSLRRINSQQAGREGTTLPVVKQSPVGIDQNNIPSDFPGAFRTDG